MLACRLVKALCIVGYLIHQPSSRSVWAEWLNGGQTEILIPERVVMHAKCSLIYSQVLILLASILATWYPFQWLWKPRLYWIQWELRTWNVRPQLRAVYPLMKVLCWTMLVLISCLGNVQCQGQQMRVFKVLWQFSGGTPLSPAPSGGAPELPGPLCLVLTPSGCGAHCSFWGLP